MGKRLSGGVKPRSKNAWKPLSLKKGLFISGVEREDVISSEEGLGGG